MDRMGDHPFDTPFSIMQAMQAELFKLREELHLERQERKAEAGKINSEIHELRDLVRRNELKEQADHDRLAKNLDELSKREDQHWKTTRHDLEADISTRCKIVDFEHLSGKVSADMKNLEKLDNDVHKIIADIQKAIEANSAGDNEFARSMEKELHSQRHMLDQNALNDQVFEETVVAQLRMAGQLLQSAGSLEKKPLDVSVWNAAASAQDSALAHKGSHG